MKNIVNKKIWQALFNIILLISAAGCAEMLEDPTKDKDTSEDINLLIVDFNFFTTRMTYKIMDASDNTEISTQAKIWFTGTNADDIVTFAGEKEETHYTSQGQLELTVDPNLEISSASPLDFTIHVEVDGYEEYSQNIQINTDGKKTYELLLYKETDGDESVLTGDEDDDSFTFSFAPIKSASIVANYAITYSILKEDLVKFKDKNGNQIFDSVEALMIAYKQNPSNFLKMKIDTKGDFLPKEENVKINGSVIYTILKKIESGDLTSLSLNGVEVQDLNGGIITQSCNFTGTYNTETYGFTLSKDGYEELTAGPITHNSLYFSYTIGSALKQELCNTGCSVTFNSSSVSSFSIDADIYDKNGNKLKYINFKGSFPETFILENVPSMAVYIAFRDNNSSFDNIATLEVEDLCSGSYEVEVEAADSYKEYQITFIAHCQEETSVSVAPTYNGYVRIKGSDDPWQGVDMAGGVVNILAMPEADYEMKLLWKADWEKTTFSTKLNESGITTGESNTSSYMEELSDGTIRIVIDYTFEQDICNDLGW